MKKITETIEIKKGIFLMVGSKGSGRSFMEARKNAFFIGKSGSGKSFTAKLLIKKLLSENPDVHIYVLDVYGEYLPLAEEMQGEIFDLAKEEDILEVADYVFDSTVYLSNNRFVCYNLDKLGFEQQSSVSLSLLNSIETLTDKPTYVFIEDIYPFYLEKYYEEICQHIANNTKNLHYVVITQDLHNFSEGKNCELIEARCNKVYF